MKLPAAILIMFIVALMISSCSNKETAKEAVKDLPKPLVGVVTSAEELKAISPDTILNRLKEGNKRFISNNITARDHSLLVMATATAQFPKSVVLSCLDSRIPVEDVFDKGIGDMFVVRNAGNIINDDVLGGMEFGCKVSGAKLILVMGHSGCGAIKAAIDEVRMGNITSMLGKIKPAIKLSNDFEGEKTSKNAAYTDEVGRNNVLHTIGLIKKKSPILKKMIDNKEIIIAGAYYDIKTGKVSFME